MTAVGVVVGALLVAAGVWLFATAWTPATPALARTVAYLHRLPAPTAPAGENWWAQLGRTVLRLGGNRLVIRPNLARSLRLTGRPVEVHAAYLVTAAVAGFTVPLLFAIALDAAGVVEPAWFVSLAVALAAAGLAVVVVQVDLRDRAEVAVRDLRHQLSAYLDVLTMLLAANHGNEGALKLAAEAGDGRLFTELRRRIVEAATAGRPTVSALAALGRELGVVELTEIAASASLATSQGAPVARSLTAKTQTLRSTLQAEQEQEARIRTAKITFPLVAMGIVFMALGLYPALASIRGG